MVQNESATAAIRSLLCRYLELFNAADFETALTCYHLPFSWIVGPTIATALTPQDFVTRMTRMRADLADQGLERSELIACTVRMLGPHAALAGVEIGRHFVKGREMEVTGGTYIVHNNGEGWRLASIIGHPVDEIVSRATRE